MNHFKSFISLLNKYPDFNYENINFNNANVFKYSDTQDPNLVTLRKTYNIDNVVTGKDTVENVAALMEWVHNELFFVGSNIYPVQNNSLSILNVRKQGALFCFYQAIVLNDVLLSLGIKSRIIKCLPYEFDMDCHVGVIIFIPEMNKWCFFDPTFNTYFTDKMGNPLSITEIREMYKNGDAPTFKHIAIKKDWILVLHGIVYETYDDWYSVYMAKNCFRFASLAESSFYCNSKDIERTVFLNPIGYEMKNEYDSDIKNSNLSLYTNNIRDFFRIP